MTAQPDPDELDAGQELLLLYLREVEAERARLRGAPVASVVDPDSAMIDATFEAARLMTYHGFAWLPGPPAWSKRIPLSDDERCSLLVLSFLVDQGLLGPS